MHEIGLQFQPSHRLTKFRHNTTTADTERNNIPTTHKHLHLYRGNDN